MVRSGQDHAVEMPSTGFTFHGTLQKLTKVTKNRQRVSLRFLGLLLFKISHWFARWLRGWFSFAFPGWTGILAEAEALVMRP